MRSPLIPTSPHLCHTLGELRYKGQRGGMEAEMLEKQRTEAAEDRETSEPKRKTRSASLLKTIKAWMRFPLKASLPSKAQMWK